VIIDVAENHAAVRGADDCGRFHVESALGPADLDRALRAASAGHGDGDGAAWVSVGWVRSTADAAPWTAVGTDWPTRFDAMLDYARGKGWLDESGTHLRAHVVKTPAVDAAGP
jgi:hypothetical protein